ncbi:MAG: hypothetical protein WC629_01445 [Candidatus Paceibacterota bacterium]|jgi:hypothetical protein
MIQVIIEKSIKYKEYNHTPTIVWLDTNAIINIRDSLIKGEDNSFVKLFNQLKEKVEKGKIICPFSGQRSEYSQGNSLEKSDDILLSLSKGFQVSMWQIRQEQIKTAIRCFLNDEDEFIFKDTDLVFKKAEREKQKNSLGFKVVVLTEQTKKLQREFLLKDLVRRKKEVKDLKLSYKTLLKSEQDAGKYVLQQSIDKNIAQYGYLNLDFDINDSWYHHLYTIIELKNISGIDDHEKLIELTKNFLSSNYFYSIPIDKISSTIISSVLMDKKNMTTNDIGDMENLSIILPYASFLMTDNAMVHIIRSRKLDTEFNTKIYSFKTMDKFIEDIKTI